MTLMLSQPLFVSQSNAAEMIAKQHQFAVERKPGGWGWSHPDIPNSLQHRSEAKAWKEACNIFYAKTFIRTNKNDPVRLLAKSVCGQPTMPFIVQPILSATNLRPYGYEILYRGVHPKNWQSVDMAMLRFLSEYTVAEPLFINLSNQTILTLDQNLLFAAHDRNTLYIEWSESVINEEKFERIKALLRQWSERGLRIVIDDFGKGRDALDRLFSFDKVHAIKIDGQLIRTMENSEFARKIVHLLVENCKENGIITIAECIETHGQFSAMQKMGVENVQGWYIDDLFSGAKKLPNCHLPQH